MLSRVADSLYWMSRYLERAEHTARVMGVQLNLMLEQDPRTSDRRWLRTLAALGHTGPVGEGALAEDPSPFALARNYALRQITGGIASARENARQVREQISSEMWEQLNRLFHEVKRIEAAGVWTRQPLDCRQRDPGKLAPVSRRDRFHHESRRGLAVHPGGPLHRARLRPRRACWICISANSASHSARPWIPGEHMEWIGLLRSCTAFEAYCKVYTADLRPERVAEFLLLNAEFPHSVRFAADQRATVLGSDQRSGFQQALGARGQNGGRFRAGLIFTPLEEIVASLCRVLRRHPEAVCAHSLRHLRGVHHLSDRGGHRSLMYYSIRHLTKFRYSSPVSESIMEARMQPRSEGPQRCLSFQLAVHPRRRIYSYRDYLGNTVHHFDVPGHHRQLVLVAEALVDVQAGPALPESLASGAWDALDATIAAGDFIEMLLPSQFGQSSELLEQFARELGVESREHARARDPLMLVLQLSSGSPRKNRLCPQEHARGFAY